MKSRFLKSLVILALAAVLLCPAGCAGQAEEQAALPTVPPEMMENAPTDVPRPTPEPDPTPTPPPPASTPKADEVIPADGDKADRASLEKMQNLLNYLAGAISESGLEKLHATQPQAEIVWPVLYDVVTRDLSGWDTDQIHRVDDNTMYVSGGYLKDAVYPYCFNAGSLQDISAAREMLSGQAAVSGSGLELKLSFEGNDGDAFSAREYAVSKTGVWRVTGDTAAGRFTVEMQPDKNSVFGFCIVGFEKSA